MRAQSWEISMNELLSVPVLATPHVEHPDVASASKTLSSIVPSMGSDYYFPQFSALPQEIRAMIWERSLPRRLVTISTNLLGHWQNEGYRLNGVDLPTAFRVCRESRAECMVRYTRIKLPELFRGRSTVRSRMYVYVSYTQDTFLFDDQSSILLDCETGAVRLEVIAKCLGLEIRRIQSIAVDYSYFYFSQPNPYQELRVRFSMLNELMFVVSRPGLGLWTNCNFMLDESRLWDLCAIGFYWPPEEKQFLENKWSNVPWIPVLRTWKLQIMGQALI